MFTIQDIIDGIDNIRKIRFFLYPTNWYFCSDILFCIHQAPVPDAQSVFRATLQELHPITHGSSAARLPFMHPVEYCFTQNTEKLYDLQNCNYPFSSMSTLWTFSLFSRTFLLTSIIAQVRRFLVSYHKMFSITYQYKQ